MRFSIDQAAFLNGVQTVQRAISTKNVLPPILSGIYLEAGDGKLILRATDLEIGIESVLPATVSGEGAVVLPARYFTEIVRKLPAMEITVEEADNGQVRISYGKHYTDLNWLPVLMFAVVVLLNQDLLATLIMGPPDPDKPPEEGYTKHLAALSILLTFLRLNRLSPGRAQASAV